jgi:hypothetical protein
MLAISASTDCRIRAAATAAEIKVGADPVDFDRVTLTHSCPFCRWERPASSEVVLRPACERCGSTLQPQTAAVEYADAPARARTTMPRSLSLAIAIAAVGLVAAAARAGYVGGGIPLAAVAGAGMSFLLVPLLRRR